MADLSALTVNELADRAGAGAQRYKLSIRRAAVAELARRANRAEAAEKERDDANARRVIQARNAESAEARLGAAQKERDEWKAAFGVKPLADPETARLYVHELAEQAVAAEKERDEALAQADRVWDQTKNMNLRYSERAEAAEAHLAETQKALEAIYKQSGDKRDWYAQIARAALDALEAIAKGETVHDGQKVYVNPGAEYASDFLARAALTTHPAADE